MSSKAERWFPERFIFSFASGSFAYNCHRCGARCCHGYGYTLDRAASVYQLTRRPALNYFLNTSSGDTVENLPSGCFFLNDENRCEIHAELGSGAKPETCRLFPFNRLRRFGSVLFVLPHASLCPLEAVDGGKRAAESEHSTIVEEITRSGISAAVKEVRTPLTDAVTALSLESCVARSSVDFEGRSTTAYLAWQLALGLGPGDALASAHQTPETCGIDEDCAAIAAMLGSDKTTLFAPDPTIDNVFNLVAPSVRARLTCLADSDELWRNTRLLGYDGVTRYLLALYAYVKLARDAGLRRVSYQTILRLDRTHHHTLVLLAHSARRVVWKAENTIPFVRFPSRAESHAYYQLWKDIVGRVQNTTLADSYCRATGDFEQAQRIAFLKVIAPLMVQGMTGPSTGARGKRSLRSAVGARLRRAIVSRCDLQMLTDLSNTLSGTRRLR